VPKQFASDQHKKKPAFYFNRPPSTAATIPITLFDRVFGQFQEDCEAYEPTHEDYAFVHRLSLSMSEFYSNEAERATQARADMATYDLDFVAGGIDGYCTDGDLRWKEFCYGLMELKAEIGAGRAEPLFQAIWYYVAFTRSICVENSFSNLPCFILYAFGKLPIKIIRALMILFPRSLHWVCGGHVDGSPAHRGPGTYPTTFLSSHGC
jgi:hypothetical protein